MRTCIAESRKNVVNLFLTFTLQTGGHLQTELDFIWAFLFPTATWCPEASLEIFIDHVQAACFT